MHHVSESMMPPDGGATGRMLGRLIGRVNRLVVQSLTIVIIAIVLLSLTVDVAVLTRIVTNFNGILAQLVEYQTATKKGMQ
ncbi:unnamed protein product [Brugia pahangi]|uniref:ABC transporter permease n=1 Tax=Brugia pahangi TaxID=6280 RepID=A0A0N4SWZ6_BRUPA|nr:unnamed protein product [Brugia pahangi]